MWIMPGEANKGPGGLGERVIRYEEGGSCRGRERRKALLGEEVVVNARIFGRGRTTTRCNYCVGTS